MREVPTKIRHRPPKTRGTKPREVAATTPQPSPRLVPRWMPPRLQKPRSRQEQWLSARHNLRQQLLVGPGPQVRLRPVRRRQRQRKWRKPRQLLLNPKRSLGPSKTQWPAVLAAETVAARLARRIIDQEDCRAPGCRHGLHDRPCHEQPTNLRDRCNRRDSRRTAVRRPNATTAETRG